MGIIKRFAFIKDEDLRKEIDVNYLFIAFIKKIYDELTPGWNRDLDEAVEFWYKKTILLLVASIVEALLLYTIKTLEIKHAKCLWVKKVQHGKPLWVLETGEKLVIYKETEVEFRDDTKFSDLISILCDKFSSEFTTHIQDKLVRMKVLRNGVHINSKLSNNKDYITTNIESLLKDAKEITDLCKSILIT